MRRVLAAAGLLVAFASAAAEPNLAGRFDLVDGDVKVQKAGSSMVVPKAGDPLYETDVVATGAKGEAHVRMEDGGFLAVRPDTKIRIVQFQAAGDENDRSVIGIVQGTLRSITGWIGSFNPKGYQIRARAATIGIRGTDHETHVRLKGDAEGEPGVYDRVQEGGTFIRTLQGRVDVAPGRAGFWSHVKPGSPRILEKVPAFFRPGRNDRRLEGMHQRIQSQLGRLRDDRRAKRGLPPVTGAAARKGVAGHKAGEKKQSGPAAQEKRQEEGEQTEEERKAAKHKSAGAHHGEKSR